MVGLPAEHTTAPGLMNLTDSEVAALQYATQVTSMEFIESLVLAGKYNWQGKS